jgi:hypothetical protein
MSEASGDPMTDMDDVHPLFFLSYARARSKNQRPRRGDPDTYVITFFDDLSESVASLVSRRPGVDPGFMDRAIRPGRPWSDELLRAIGTCDVFVALLSGPYTSSRSCGMEWFAFSQRKGTSEAEPGRPPAIIPVIWAPFPEERTPATIRRFQRFSPAGLPNVDIQAEYEQHGVFGLMWMMRTASYRGVVWQLAQEIAQRHHDNHALEQRTLGENELRDAFRENEP